MIIYRDCAVCGNAIEVRVYDDGSYEGGEYFGTMEVPVGNGEWNKVGTSEHFGHKMKLVDWSGEYEEAEYWECELCSNEPEE